MLGDYVNPYYFLISFAIGILVVYVMEPPKQIIRKFPSPDNFRTTIYKDEHSDSCYRFDVEETECGANSVAQPIVENMSNLDKKNS